MLIRQTRSEDIAFSGTIPAYYEDFLGPLFFEPFADYVSKQIEKLEPKAVLELASGTGQLTRKLRKLLPKGTTLLATDINPAMIENGKRKLDNVEWQVVDATRLPFGEEEFDCIVAQFGVMFYSDRVKAYKEAYRALKPGGVFVFTAWDSLEFNPAARITHDVTSKFFPVDSPAFYKNFPFGYHNESIMQKELNEAVFKKVKIEVVGLTGYSETPETAATGLIQGMPLFSSIIDRDATLVPAIKNEVAKELQIHFGSKNLQVPIQARVVSAIKE